MHAISMALWMLSAAIAALACDTARDAWRERCLVSAAFAVAIFAFAVLAFVGGCEAWQ